MVVSSIIGLVTRLSCLALFLIFCPLPQRRTYFFFFFNDPAPPELSPLPLPAALPILGALSITGIPALRAPFEPLVPDTIHVRNTNRYHRPPAETEAEFTSFLLDDLESAIVQAGPETVAMVLMEPVQNAGGAFTPPAGYFQGVRAICDRYGILLCADEGITGLRRLGA